MQNIKNFQNSLAKFCLALLVEQIDQENFVDIKCKKYTNERIIEQLYKINLIKKKLADIEAINQFTIQSKAGEFEIIKPYFRSK